MLDLFNIPLEQLIWARESAGLLMIISAFYIPAAIDLGRYRVNAYIAVFVSRAFGATFFFFAVVLFGQPAGFLSISFVDAFIGSTTGYCLIRIATLEKQTARPASSDDRRPGPIADWLPRADRGADPVRVVCAAAPGSSAGDQRFRCASSTTARLAMRAHRASPIDLAGAADDVSRTPAGQPGWLRRHRRLLGGGEELPVGFSKKTVGVIPRVAPNCAFCHQGFRLHPDDPATLVPAGAGTRVNVQGFLRFLIKSGDDPRFAPDNVMTAITEIYDMPLWERLLYRYLLIPAVKSAFRDQAVRFAWTNSRPDWGPGRIDPFNPVKFFNLGLPDDGTIGNSDIMPLWDFSTALADATRQYSLHWDGLSSNLRETAIAGAIGDGMDLSGLCPNQTGARKHHRFRPSAKTAALAVLRRAQGR